MKKILVTGYPRSGTLHIATFLQKCGLSMPHEKDGADGTVSWKRAIASNEYDRIVHQVRNPLHVLRSVHTFLPVSWNLLLKHSWPIPFPVEDDDFLTKGMWTWLCWNQLIEMVSDWRFRVEEDESKDFLSF